MPACRRRAVCGHELGHAVLHGQINSLLLGDADSRMEQEADLFAATLLLAGTLPEDGADVASIMRQTGLPEGAVRRAYHLI